MSNGTEKKGLSPVAWIAIGCGAIVLIGVIAVAGVVGFGVFKAKEFVEEAGGNPAKAIAETAIRLNPELDLVETDDEAGTITFRNNKTGEEATLNFEDIAEGKFSVTTDEGEFSMDASDAGEGGGVTLTGPEGEVRYGGAAALEDRPDWVPIYPGADDTESAFSTQTAQGVSGMLMGKTTDSVDDVVGHYKKWFEDEGYTVQNETTSTTPQGKVAAIMGELEGRTVNVGVVEQDGETTVTVNYNAKTE